MNLEAKMRFTIIIIVAALRHPITVWTAIACILACLVLNLRGATVIDILRWVTVDDGHFPQKAKVMQVSSGRGQIVLSWAFEEYATICPHTMMQTRERKKGIFYESVLSSVSEVEDIEPNQLSVSRTSDVYPDWNDGGPPRFVEVGSQLSPLSAINQTVIKVPIWLICVFLSIPVSTTLASFAIKSLRRLLYKF